jgi:hypothetical protein
MEHETETTAIADDARIQQLMTELGSDDGLQRRRAREALERLGERTAPYLMHGLRSGNVNVRWESAKALRAVEDPRAAPALVNALMDESFEIQWLAAEALIALGEKALIPLLEGVISDYDSVYLRQGVHHVLHDLERKGSLGPLTLRVLNEMRSIDPREPYPLSAKRALEALRVKQDVVQSAANN